MKSLKALITKNNLNKAYVPLFINVSVPVGLKNVKEGNIIEIFNRGSYTIFIIVDHKNLPPFIQKDLHTGAKTVFIRFAENDFGYSFWDSNSFKEKFPYHKIRDDIKITRIWTADINIKTLKSKNDFKVLYNEICDKIKQELI